MWILDVINFLPIARSGANLITVLAKTETRKIGNPCLVVPWKALEESGEK